MNPITCPSCRGRKFTFALVDGSNYRGPAQLPCSTCRGAGEIDPQTEDWIEIGGMHRKWRVAQWESQRECARRLGITCSALSAMEAGRADPTMLIEHIPEEIRPRKPGSAA